MHTEMCCDRAQMLTLLLMQEVSDTYAASANFKFRTFGFTGAQQPQTWLRSVHGHGQT